MGYIAGAEDAEDEKRNEHEISTQEIKKTCPEAGEHMYVGKI